MIKRAITEDCHQPNIWSEWLDRSFSISYLRSSQSSWLDYRMTRIYKLTNKKKWQWYSEKGCSNLNTFTGWENRAITWEQFYSPQSKTSLQTTLFKNKLFGRLSHLDVSQQILIGKDKRSLTPQQRAAAPYLSLSAASASPARSLWLCCSLYCSALCSPPPPPSKICACVRLQLIVSGGPVRQAQTQPQSEPRSNQVTCYSHAGYLWTS